MLERMWKGQRELYAWGIGGAMEGERGKEIGLSGGGAPEHGGRGGGLVEASRQEAPPAWCLA